MQQQQNGMGGYSIQQYTNNYVAGQFTSSSLQNHVLHTYGYGQSTVGGGAHNLLRTANATREDFNIEDLHCQVVLKVQRQRRVLREIEQLPNEREQEEFFFVDDPAEFGSGRIPTGKLAGSNKKGGAKKHPHLTVHMPEEAILSGDGCARPAITFGIKC
jgi:hypothetical protein